MDRNTFPAHVEPYKRLLEIARDLASTLDLDTLLDHIIHAAADLTSAEAASILLYDELKRQLFFQAATNLEMPLMGGLVVPVDASIAGWVLTHRQPVIVSDTHRDPRHYEQIAKATNIETKSLIGAPMVTKNKVIGVLEAINKSTGPFTEDDLELLVALSAQAAVAIENARLFQQSDLISELVHELRTPLASLNAAAYLIARPEVSLEQRNQIIQTMQQETNRLTEMASSFLDLARLESGRSQFQISEVDLGEIVREAAAVMSIKIAEKHHQMGIEISENIPSFSADPDKLKQVVINLLSNAIKYTPFGGEIHLEVNAEPGFAVIIIRDNGPGIPNENISHLFERFYRVPGMEQYAQGTGLGLAISKRIIDAHQGEIRVESTLGQGTTFTIKLPIKSR